MITLGLSQIQVGAASASGTMPGSMAKLGKTYKDTCKMTQDAADVTEHFEEGVASPEVRKKTKKMPKIMFSIMNADVQMLIDYIGGTNTGTSQAPVWGFDGTEVVANRAIRVVTEQGLVFDIPNGDIEAVINSEFTANGIFLVEFTVTPMAVTSGKALRGYAGANGLEVSPTSLSFTSSADTTGKTITAASTGNLTFAAVPSDVEWATVTKSGKVATVKVSANANSEARSTTVTLIADGLTTYVEVTQAGA